MKYIRLSILTLVLVGVFTSLIKGVTYGLIGVPTIVLSILVLLITIGMIINEFKPQD